ncbi:MAG: sulfur carrier protein ThiS [Planctomycetota bacterium]|jgi:sulfur carrier protein
MEVLKINGIEKQFPDGLPKTLIELLKQLDMDIHQATVVAEINGKIIAREDFSQTRVSPGQKIELVRFVGGG